MESSTAGKTLSTEHINKISLSTATTKRSKNPNLTNEKIREIYELKDKMKQVEVAEKYGMKREMIRRIWQRKLLPTDDPDFKGKLQEEKKDDTIITTTQTSTPPLTFEQKTSIGKRSLKSEQYLEIIDWKIKKEKGELLNGKKIFSTKLAEYLSQKWGKKVSDDMVKNIWKGKTKLYNFEFSTAPPISYEKYLEIIGK
jgi:hypothetical protein